jgi:hypothetical protein
MSAVTVRYVSFGVVPHPNPSKLFSSSPKKSFSHLVELVAMSTRASARRKSDCLLYIIDLSNLVAFDVQC